MLSTSQAAAAKRALTTPKTQAAPKGSAAERLQQLQDAYHGLTPKLPADLLYQAVCRRFGRFYDGGHAVYELEFGFAERHFRADIALPEFRLVLEMDGWESHGRTLAGFKKDREKSLVFERRGWSVVRFSNEQVRTNLPDVIAAVEEIISFRVKDPLKRNYVQRVSFDRSKYTANS